MQIVEYTKKVLKKADDKTEEMVKKLKKEHSKLVKGKFEFIDAQGGWLEFTYRYFKDDPLMMIKLVHGEITELPMGIVKHLNNTYKKVRKINPDMSTGKVVTSFELTSRIRFTPVEYLS